MAITADQLLQRLKPGLSSDDRVFWLEYADGQLPADLCPNERPLLLGNLAAHLSSYLAEGGGDAGPVASRREGDVAVSYAVAMSTASLKVTSYGLEYLRILRRCQGPAMYVSEAR